MLAELREYARSDPKPKDAPSVEMIIEYLNNLFERSILGTKVRQKRAKKMKINKHFWHGR